MKNKHQNNDDEKIRHKILVCFYFMIVLKLVTVFFNSVSSTPNDTEEYSDRKDRSNISIDLNCKTDMPFTINFDI
ncbi:MAG: hypothetical protein EGR74_10105 [Ruminiclostridium sp.]|jgi:hypothetical protein|nr:hypothetical protein [Ruminiclostridium sp.]